MKELETQIRERAYRLFQARAKDGDALSDWLQAEREIQAQETGPHRGPARAQSATCRSVTDADGHDFENPS